MWEQTVTEARSRLLASRFTGTLCPVCSRHYQARRRTITGSMAHALVAICQRVKVGDKFHLPSLLEAAAADDASWPSARQGGDASKLYYWRLLERPTAQRGRRAGAGIWILTASGLAFARGKYKVPRYAIIEARQLVGHEGGEVDIFDIIDKKFCLEETEIVR